MPERLNHSEIKPTDYPDILLVCVIEPPDCLIEYPDVLTIAVEGSSHIDPKTAVKHLREDYHESNNHDRDVVAGVVRTLRNLAPAISLVLGKNRLPHVLIKNFPLSLEQMLLLKKHYPNAYTVVHFFDHKSDNYDWESNRQKLRDSLARHAPSFYCHR